MKSLKQFGFWSFLIGIVLIVLSAMPGSDIPMLSEESQMPLVLGLILFVCGVLSYVVHSSFSDIEYQMEHNDTSVWREINELSDRSDRSTKELERDTSDRLNDTYTDMREYIQDLRNEIKECKTSCCSTESLNAAGSRLAQKTMNT